MSKYDIGNTYLEINGLTHVYWRGNNEVFCLCEHRNDICLLTTELTRTPGAVATCMLCLIEAMKNP